LQHIEGEVQILTRIMSLLFNTGIRDEVGVSGGGIGMNFVQD